MPIKVRITPVQDKFGVPGEEPDVYQVYANEPLCVHLVLLEMGRDKNNSRSLQTQVLLSLFWHQTPCLNYALIMGVARNEDS